MSLETRSNSALFKRAEQLKRWEESDTNREPVSPKIKSRRVKFSSGCVFLAACAAGDKEEVLKLLEKGADINTANVDGLTALHQACIDDNLDMVEFLVEQGADVNRGDNEGWTPLHATASCGFKYIAKYLIEKGADVAAVNNDGELALDIAECQRMTDLLRDEIRKRGIDCDAARNDEEIAMLRDAKEWLATKSSLVNEPHPKTGASALHVAAAKGYVNVMQVLLQCGADIDAQDTDGWSPIHAAAHWGQEEACRLLVEHLADLDAKNYVGQTAFDLADNSMLTLLTNLKEKQDKEEVNNRKAKKRAETQDRSIEPDSLTQVKKVKVEITGGPQEISKSNDIEMENESESESEVETSESESEESSSEEEEKKNKANAQNINDKVTIKEPEVNKPPLPPKTIENSEEKMPWRQQITKPKSDLNSPEKSNVVFDDYKPSNLNNENEVTLRRTKSFQNDELSNEVSTSTANTNISASPTTTTSPQAQNNQSAFRRSFVPPVRDEESETQRKAHAKRVRETRRSTQGVTLEEIKSAEQLVKLKNQPNNSDTSGQAGDNSNSGLNVSVTIAPPRPEPAPSSVSETTNGSATESHIAPVESHERRPSWRLKVDGGSKFKLEDATKPEAPNTPSFIRRLNSSTNSSRPSSAPIETAETTVTIPLRRPKSLEEKEQDKENDVRNAQATLATQAAIQRRRRPKRRSTGVVSFDNVEDMDQEKDPAAGGDAPEATKLSHESGSERSSRSRVSSTVDIRNENGEIDYKKLYEEQLVENDRLKDKLRKSDEELKETKQTLERINVVTSKNSLSELEKRERRAMERKLSEMEEELKQLQKLKAENERLKVDNRSLTRVINKLTNSAKK
ncbi:protein phosphatase 1 regulatory subunit 12B isoform X8 [Dendroctonus ponderosae]|uniref:protein phosphatase 1 regulatory subunit 12B isoform X8 n=1 Tax=Dendroctonus ponderosae TaxID=77166 RepID=UPI002034EA72|nr:protein phosphatase 1 regulatory subunit 12B isoform X8 [Dendroctonus ponderosae]